MIYQEECNLYFQKRIRNSIWMPEEMRNNGGQNFARNSYDEPLPRGRPSNHSPDGSKENRTRRQSPSRGSHYFHEPGHRGRPSYHSPDGTKEKRTGGQSSRRGSYYSHEPRHPGRSSYHSPDGSKEKRTRRQSSSRPSHYSHEPWPRDQSPRRVPHRLHSRDESYSKKSPRRHYDSNLRDVTPPRSRSSSRGSSNLPAGQSSRRKANEWPNLSEGLRARHGPPLNNDDREPVEGELPSRTSRFLF